MVYLRMCTLSDIPHELYPMILTSCPILKIETSNIRSCIIGEYIQFTFNIIYTNSFIRGKIHIFKNNIDLCNRIDKFIDNINKCIPCEIDLCLYYEYDYKNYEGIGTLKQKDELLIWTDYDQRHEPQIIKYDGKKYMIGDIVLDNSARNCVIELLNYVKKTDFQNL